MERKFYTDDFEQLLKENADDFRMYPSKRVWHSIYNDLHPGRKWPSTAVSILLIAALLIAGYWNSNNSTEEISTTINKKTSPANIASVSTDGSSIPLNNGSGSANSSHQRDLSVPENKTQKINPSSSMATIYADGGIYKPNKSTSPLSATDNVIDDAGVIALNKIATPYSNTISGLPQTHDGLVEKTNIEVIIVPHQPGITKAENNVIELTQSIDANINTGSFELVEKKAITPGENASLTNAAVFDNKPKEKSLTPVEVATKNTLSAEDKAWIENYALHNKTERKKWKERSTITFYVTPNIGFRNLFNDSKYNVAPTTAPLGAIQAGIDADKAVNQKPGLGLEAGININYAVAKNLRLKAGIQGNYTNYSAKADETNHPVLTTIMFVDPNSGFPFMQASSTTLANSSAFQPVTIHNKTYQISIPLGFAYKLSGNDKMEWFAGGTIQPTLVLGGKAYLISADRKNYVADASHLRKLNLNAGFETYINYKFDGFTLQAGPQFRYQILSTNYKIYTVQENLFNLGVKVGVVKSF